MILNPWKEPYQLKVKYYEKRPINLLLWSPWSLVVYHFPANSKYDIDVGFNQWDRARFVWDFGTNFKGGKL